MDKEKDAETGTATGEGQEGKGPVVLRASCRCQVKTVPVSLRLPPRVENHGSPP